MENNQNKKNGKKRYYHHNKKKNKKNEAKEIQSEEVVEDLNELDSTSFDEESQNLEFLEDIVPEAV